MKNNKDERKVLFFAPSFANTGRIKGGVTIYSRFLLEEISSTFQIDHHVIGNRTGNDSALRRFLYPIYDTLRLIFKLLRWSYDVIHMNPSMRRSSIMRDSFYLSVLSFFGYSRKTVIFFHGWNESTINQIKGSVLLKSFFLRLYNKVGKILVLATPFKQQLVELGVKGETISVVTTLYKRFENIPLRKKSSEDGVIKLLFMSRFVKDKGLNIACSVLKLLVDNGFDNVHFIFAGDGPEMNRLISFINDNNLDKFASLSGYVTGQSKDKIFAEGDIFLFPTKYAEGLPVVILEAMGAGQVVISTPVGGIPEVVENGVNGFLHNSDNPAVYFDSVKRLIKDRDLLFEIQERNRRKAENNYEASVVSKKIESLYKEVANVCI